LRVCILHFSSILANLMHRAVMAELTPVSWRQQWVQRQESFWLGKRLNFQAGSHSHEAVRFTNCQN